MELHCDRRPTACVSVLRREGGRSHVSGQFQPLALSHFPSVLGVRGPLLVASEWVVPCLRTPIPSALESWTSVFPPSLPLAYPRVHPTLCFLPNYSKLFRHFMAQPRYHTHLSPQRWGRRRKWYVRRPGFCPRTLGVRLAPQNRASQGFSSCGTFRK